ncbi:MAG: hypothetical protein COW01_08150 [Bdellovibrionales bacterium CG12_big_fil_rev_8_21_14_0_65_38_15]|nr:MAG: hypothetical protein COW79_10640 [Bdellovibrionales bacterium CG22_combo_CG10-13_8_21_14_all_38_13]PIQ55342.1 MAG: hypothetical protein COW01_08150 [Bdellovibrionales bacterium CG12_big_fil_rev_8_21_14_0_65_38_15]PIR28952.1 MAG: hypothetical protein COV38_13195 [Bdellovibrionales bacterium CG11_big_fil_rev_8_21_14_0_20_38_13]
MKKANKFSIPKLIRKSCATTLVLVLLPHPWVSEARAQSAVNVGMQAITTLSSTIQQGMMQAQAMRPVNLAPSQVRSVPAVNLPAPLNECLISPAKIPMPRYCEEIGPPSEYITPAGLAASPTFNQFSQTSEFAKQQIIELDRMLDMGKNEASNGARTGIQCLVDKQLKERTRRQAVQNAIQARIDEIKQKNEAFKEQVKMVELQMKKIRGELLGSEESGPKHVTDNLNPPIKNFPPNCQAMFEKIPGINTAKVGLVGFRDGPLKAQTINGGEFLANEQIYKNDMQRFVDHARKHIAKNGLESYMAGGINEFKGNPKLLARIKQTFDQFKDRTKREENKIRSQLSEVGYQAPPLDKNFKADFAVFKSDSKEFFRKKAVNDCVTGADNGIALDPKTILDALRQESTNNQGTTVISYRKAMENILATDSFMEDKLSALKALDDSYGAGNITISIANDKAKIQNMPPYMYFKNAVAACVNDYNDDKTFSTSASGRSQAVKIERAETYLNDLKNLNDNFLPEMSKEITSDIVNCNGRATEVGSCSLNSNNFDVSSPGFCFQSARSCANEMSNCSAVAKQLVEQKTTELNASADQYNNMVATLFTEQAATFAQFKAAVMQEAGLMNALIPGADFAFPEDNFISMPELTLDPKTNTYIRGGDSAKIGQQLNAMAGKMAELKTALVAQGEKADKQINQYITEQRKNVEKNKTAFQDIVKTCNQRITEATEINRDYNSTMQKNEQDAKSAAGDFCRRFYDLSTNPNAACGDVEELYDASIRAAQFVDINARRYANNLRNLCSETQSEREAGTEDGGGRKKDVRVNVAEACNDEAEWNEAIQPYVAQYAASLPPDSDDSDLIVAYLENAEGAPKDKEDLLSKLSDDFKKDRDLYGDLKKVLRKTELDGYKRESTIGDIYASSSVGIPLPTLDAEGKLLANPAYKDSANSEVQAQIAILKSVSPTVTVKQRVEAYNQLHTFMKDTAENDPGKKNRVDALAAVGRNTADANYNNDKALLKAAQVDLAISKLPKTDGDACKQLVADSFSDALASCLSETTPAGNCVTEKQEELIEEGEVDGARAIASLGLQAGNTAEINQLFSDLGETDGMACDALASNRRNTVSDIERLDRDILGDQYDDLMRR